MLVSLALIWLSYKTGSFLPLAFLVISWLPDIVLIGALADIIESKRKKGD